MKGKGRRKGRGKEIDVLLSLDSISVGYGDIPILNGVTLSIHRGEIYGLIGKNGAGKSTIIKTILGLLNPDDGRIIKKKGISIGYAPEVLDYYNNMTGYQYLKYFSRLYGIEPSSIDGKVSDALAIVGLRDRADDRIDEYSKGMKQRLNIARCIITDPDLYIFDEPLNGLDPYWKEWFLDFLKKERKRGKSALVSSHDLRYMNDICDRIGILRDGKIIQEGHPSEIIHGKPSGEVTYRFRVSFPDEAVIKALKDKFDYITDVDISGDYVTVRAACDLNGQSRNAIETEILRYLLDNNIGVSLTGNVLEDVYLSYAGDPDDSD